jgi:serine/threonine protein kinase
LLIRSTTASAIDEIDEIVLADFGTAVTLEIARNPGDAPFPLSHLPPECVVGEGCDYSAEIWSVGCVLYELRTGQNLFGSIPDYVHIGAIFSLMLDNGKFKDKITSVLGNFSVDDDLLLYSFLKQCMKMFPVERPPPETLQEHPFFATLPAEWKLKHAFKAPPINAAFAFNRE